MFVIDLSSQSLTNIDILADCVNIMILNLKKNQIKYPN